MDVQATSEVNSGELPFVDTYHMSGPYKDTLSSASTLDADDDLYPLAYGVVNIDDEEN